VRIGRSAILGRAGTVGFMSKALIGTVRTAAATAAFAGVHSLLASRGAKQWFAGRFGQKAYDGTYRATYNAVAVGTSAALVGYMAAQPAREVYRVRGAAAGAMRIGQAACAAGLAAAVWGAGPLRFSGITHLRRWLTGRAVAPAPEGQNPGPTPEGRFRPTGIFRWCRHPANFFAVPLIWLNPRMTTKLLAFNLVSSAYFYVGSLHTDRRMRREVGIAYESYKRQVPLFVPGTGGEGTPARVPSARTRTRELVRS